MSGKYILGSNESGEVSIDLELLLRGRLLLQGSSGSGKSETLKKICYVTRDDIQSLIVDPEGEYSPLRSEMPFLLVGPGGEVPASLETAGIVAHRLLETGVSAILDLYELGHNKREWVRRFLTALDTAPKELRRETLLFIDEAHIFAPEAGNSMDGCAAAVADIASRGRKRGIGLVVVTQRLALLSNHIIGLCENLLVGRTGLIDAPRTAKLFGKGGKEARDFVKDIGRVGDGKFLAYGRAFHLLEPTLFQVERVAGSTLAKASKSGKKITPPTPEQLRDLLPRFADIPQEAKAAAETMDTLRRELRESLAKVAALEKAQSSPKGTPVDERKVQMLVRELETLSGAVDALQRGVEQEADTRRRALELIGELQSILQPSKGNAALAVLARSRGKAKQLAKELTTKQPDETVETWKPYSKVDVSFAQPTPGDQSVPARLGVTKPEQNILNALGWFREIGVSAPETEAVAMMAGYKPLGGAFGSPKASLTRKGWISTGNGCMQLTAEGDPYVQPSNIEKTNDSLQEAVMARFGEPERKVLRVLLGVWPDSMPANEVAQKAGYNPKGGAFGSPRSNLVKAAVIEVVRPGVLRAKDLLFPEGRR